MRVLGFRAEGPAIDFLYRAALGGSRMHALEDEGHVRDGHI